MSDPRSAQWLWEADAAESNRAYLERVTTAIQNHAEKHKVPYLWAQACLANGVSQA